MRTWLVRVGLAVALVVIAVLFVPGWRLATLWGDDQALDAIVVAVALDWRDFGEPKARERLQLELDRSGLDAVRDEDCTMTTSPEGLRQVRCAWTVQLAVPGMSAPSVLAFDSEASVDARGTLKR